MTEMIVLALRRIENQLAARIAIVVDEFFKLQPQGLRLNVVYSVTDDNYLVSALDRINAKAE